MLHKLISLSPDLKKLRDEGFEVEINGAFLLVHNIPYVNIKKEIAFGTIVSKLNLAGDITAKPEDHVVYFIGEHPCNNDGTVIKAIQHSSQDQVFDGITINHSFSNKPTDGYPDYYEKITSYVKIISHQAASIDNSVNARTFNVIESTDSEICFHYIDTNSSRAEIDVISSKLKSLKIAIVGLGGTGSYILDLVAKTPVKEIHLFDGDTFLQHNAFRTPGAASIEKLREKSKKVNYLHEVYSKLHKYITPHDQYITSSNLNELFGMDFVFICVDKGGIKKLLIEKLIENGVKFIDVGMGVEVVDGLINGSVRVTTSTTEKNNHISRRISFSDAGNDGYSQNIQIAELNALNASLAVIKWKKIYQFYHDLEKEFNTAYDINVNKLQNDENIS
ncbi:MAG: ThiF family adenylyltransferase [Patescibacteria group bacterium]|jgi:hypothetical protein